MNGLRLLSERISTALCPSKCYVVVPSCTMKYFAPPPNFEDLTMPDRPKLRLYEKTPQFPSNVRPPKMQKRLRYMRGPEELHNFLVHKQFGIQAEQGGRMRIEHFEMARLSIARSIDVRRMFAIWRVDPPWQPVTKKSQGMRMGGGKGAIDHYVTPVKAGRIILELGGKCELWEVQRLLKGIAVRLPFGAKLVTQESMEQDAKLAKELEETNVNPYTFKYYVQNDMGGCRKWISPVDLKWFGKYV